MSKLQDKIRANKRTITKATREIDREIQRLQNEEKKHAANLKKAAKDNQQNSAKLFAKQIVRGRAQVQRLYQMRANLSSMEMQIQIVSSQQALVGCMKNMNKIMGTMSRQIKVPEMQKIMMEFQRQNDMMEQKQEIMDDAMDEAFGAADEEEEADKMINQILDEFSIQMPGVNQSEISLPNQQAAVAPAQDDMESRLANLRRDD
ncbi:putative Charged multivesicular body protein 2a [Blattamonas nauphoetae]|uniref:Charged multivesicular body protein 2a n=1 Tax=Blattamonas nauphoetae TaxID=2049346 RepID=A0ABQ9XJ09_9EUKA|nr:putative Charged multivesicular body protein 2a [Blattamonas nauphoetae]